ncbi:MAG: UDP-N-acetylglucosamine 1-carboxyvinyltransferase [Candidatus Pacebacteria bacterium]|nr:UDP-N-acetylglucosamine 1-carboxyvinyltransferase [Candidatus Paceibacterota bacterium]
MNSFEIVGGKPLFGSVRIGGAKNASYKLMLAALLGDTPSRILNFSHIQDVTTVGNIITSLGGEVKKVGERALVIDPSGMDSFELSNTVGEEGRFSSMFIAPLLARFGKAIVPMPGGDKIGKRPLDWHFDGLRALGADVSLENGIFFAQAEKLYGANYRFHKNTHTGTETIILAAVLAEGTTRLENVSEEPEVDDLIEFLIEMGAKISRPEHRVIEIIGVEKLNGAIHKLMPDRNEAVSYACAAIATEGDIIIENANSEHLTSFLAKLDEIGAGFEVGQYGIRFFYKGPLKATDVTTAQAPGFMTDWQPLWATLMTQAVGTSTIHETIYQSRFQYVKELQAMGAHITAFQPEVANPVEQYNFEYEESDKEIQHAIAISGPTQLQAGEFSVKDLRHGATLVIAALIATGKSTISSIGHIDRGYESLDERLRSLGAEITRT